MTIRRVISDAVPEPPPCLFSNCLQIGETIYVSGQHAGEPDGSIAGDGTAGEQARSAFKKIKALLEAAGATMDDVVKLNVYLTDMSKRTVVSEVRREFFRGDFPCSTLVGVLALAEPRLTVEIDAVAVKTR